MTFIIIDLKFDKKAKVAHSAGETRGQRAEINLDWIRPQQTPCEPVFGQASRINLLSQSGFASGAMALLVEPHL
jgi:hypothetical protein